MCSTLVLAVAVFAATLSNDVTHAHGGHARATAGQHPGETERPSGLHDPNVVHDKEHIMEHYEGQASFNESEMSPEELEFHYFKLHDFDNNTMLDGLEIYKALTHLLPFEEGDDYKKKVIDKMNLHGKSPEQVIKERKEEELKYYMDIVDSVLEEDDMDNDGYLTYAEYVMARKREEAREVVKAARDTHGGKT